MRPYLSQPFRDDYELILLDPRGHGASDKPHDPTDYAFDRRVADVTAVLDHAGIERAIFWGYSMGGHVGYAFARYAPQRFHALIIGGMHPYAKPPESPMRQYAETLRVGRAAGMVAGLEQRFGPEPPARRARLLANDADALAADSTAMCAAPSFADALASLCIPVLIYAGDCDQPNHDNAERAATDIPQVTFVTLPGLEHMQGIVRSDLVIPHVRAFLAAVEAVSTAK